MSIVHLYFKKTLKSFNLVLLQNVSHLKKNSNLLSYNSPTKDTI